VASHFLTKVADYLRPASRLSGAQHEVLQRRGSTNTSPLISVVDLQIFHGMIDITRSLRTENRREASRRLALWETHIPTYLAFVRKPRSEMTHYEFERLR